jgi:hypothetical protein
MVFTNCSGEDYATILNSRLTHAGDAATDCARNVEHYDDALGRRSCVVARVTSAIVSGAPAAHRDAQLKPGGACYCRANTGYERPALIIIGPEL